MSDPTGGEPFALSEEEAQALAEAAAAFADALPAGRDTPYRQLAAAALERAVDVDLLPTLERVCVTALETGQAHRIGSAEAERLLMAVYRRTPGGKALAAEASDVNRVLAELGGRRLTSAKLTCRMPGRYLLALAVDGFDLTVAIEPEGVQIRSLQSG